MCDCNCCVVNNISPELVLRGPIQKSPHNSNEISAFDPELVLRDVPREVSIAAPGNAAVPALVRPYFGLVFAER